MVRHPAAGTEPGLAQRDHSLTLAEVVKSLFYNAFINFTYVGCEGDGTVVTDLLPGFSPLRNGSDGGVFLLQSRNIILIDTLIIIIIKNNKNKRNMESRVGLAYSYRYRFLIIKTFGLLILLLKLCFIRFS